jgi:hypothetical protein
MQAKNRKNREAKQKAGPVRGRPFAAFSSSSAITRTSYGQMSEQAGGMSLRQLERGFRARCEDYASFAKANWPKHRLNRQCEPIVSCVAILAAGEQHDMYGPE